VLGSQPTGKKKKWRESVFNRERETARTCAAATCPIKTVMKRVQSRKRAAVGWCETHPIVYVRVERRYPSVFNRAQACTKTTFYAPLRDQAGINRGSTMVEARLFRGIEAGAVAWGHEQERVRRCARCARQPLHRRGLQGPKWGRFSVRCFDAHDAHDAHEFVPNFLGAQRIHGPSSSNTTTLMKSWAWVPCASCASCASPTRHCAAFDAP